MNFTNQEQEIFLQGLLIGSLVVLVLAVITIVFLNKKQRSLKVKITSQLDSVTKSKEMVEAELQRLLQEQQDNQESLEDSVQSRTLELHVALQELEEANQELERITTIDELSGLHNRRFYDQKILAEYRRSKRNLTPLSLVIIDIDFFKKVNDTYGHIAGDQCLVWVSMHIKQSLKRSSDLAFRYGGEEFCLILPDTDSTGAKTLADDLRKEIAKRAFEFENKEIKLTISCGISTYQQQKGISPSQIFSGADSALYQAKDGGRNQIKYHEFVEE